MKKPSRSLFSIAVAVLFLLCFSALHGCDYLPFGYVPIPDIINNPARYEGRQVKVKGVVAEVTKISLLGIRCYTLKDQGSEIVVTVRETLPTADQQVVVVGVVENLMIIGNQSIGLHLSEIKRIEPLF